MDNEPTYNQLINRITELESKLAKTEWLLEKESRISDEPYTPYYGDITELNSERTILDNVGKQTLNSLTSELMDLLDTSVAIYEKNGDFAFGIFNSGWCQLLDAASRKLCNTKNNATALKCGKWLCHEDCWAVSKSSILSKKTEDRECVCGLKLLAEPIFNGDEVVGSINIGYGNPPTVDATLLTLAKKFNIEFETLKQKSEEYKPRPDFIIEIAKKRLKSVAKLIGEIVSRNESEKALKKSKIIIETTTDAVITTDLEGSITLWNYGAEKLYGYTSEEMLGKPVDLIYKKEDLPILENLINKLINGENIQAVELALIDKHQNEVNILLSLSPIKDANGKVIELLGINKNITDRVKAEKALRESEELLKKAENISDQGSWKWDIVNDKWSFSENWLKIHGYDHTGISTKELLEIAHPDDRAKIEIAFQNAISNKEPLSLEGRIIQQNTKKVRKIKSIAEVYFLDNGKPDFMIGVAQDITERKKAEEEIEKNLEIMLLGEEIAKLGHYERNWTTGEGYWSKGFYELLGVEEGDVECSHEVLSTFFHPDDREYVEEYIRKAIIEKTYMDIEFRLIQKDGNELFIHGNGKTIYDKAGRPVSTIGTFQDITERRQAEEKIIYQSQLLNVIDQAIITTDQFGKVVYINPAAEKMYGWLSDEVLGKNANEMFSSPKMLEAGAKIVAALQAGNSWSGEFLVKNKNGREFWVEITDTPIFDNNNKIKGIIGVSSDITERKQAEEELKESEEKFAKYFNSNPSSTFVWKSVENDFKLIDVNETADKYTADKAKSFIGLKASDIYKDLPELLDKLKQCYKTKRTIDFEYYYKNRSQGESDWLKFRFCYVEPELLLIYADNINEQKKAEDALKESEERFRTLSDLTFEGILIHDNGVVVDANQSLLNMFEFSLDEVIGKNILALGIPEERHKDIYEYMQSKTVEPYEIDVVRRDGSRFPIEVVAKEVKIEGRSLRVAAVRDITDRKKAEEALKENERKFRLTLDKSPFAIAVVDPEDSEVIYWSQTAQEIFGHTPKIVDEWYELAYPDKKYRKDVKERWKPFVEKAKETDAVINAGEYQISCKDGSVKTCELYVHHIPGNMIVTLQDITDRKKAEIVIQKNTEIEKIISKISTGFINLKAIEQNIQNSLELTGSFLEVSRAYVFNINSAFDTMDNTFEWCSEGVEPQIENLKNIPVASIPWWMRKLNNDELILIEDVLKMPEEASVEQTMLQQQNIKSLIVLPIRADEQLIGFLGFDNIKKTGEWNQESIYLLRVFSEIMGNAILRKKAEEALKESEERYRELVNTVNSGIAIYEVINDGKSGSDYIIRDFNQFALMHEKIKIEDVIGKSLKDIRPNIDEYGLIDTFRKVWKTGESAFFPAKVYIDENYSNYYENWVFRLPSGEIVAIYDDVTERESAHIELLKSEERYDLTMQAINDGMWDWDIASNEIYFNERYYTMAGYKAFEFPCAFEEWQKRVHPDDIDFALNEINRHVKKETNIFDLSFRFLKKNGNWMWIRGRGKIVQYDKDGKPLRMVGTHTDVTHRMLAEEKVKRAEQRFRALIEKATDGIVINDAEGHIVYASPNSMRHFGYTQEEFAKKPNGSELTHPDDLPMVLEHFNRVAQNPEYSPTIEYRFRKKDGEYRWIETTFTNLLNDPAINGFVLNFRDITERKKAEEELQRISKLESLGVLAGGIAHNFKNILTTMALSAEIAIFKPDKAEKHLNKIIKSIEQASSLATRFQTFSKTDKPIFEPSDINSIIMESAEIALTGSSIVPKFYFDDLIPKMLLDAKRMNEVFTNLLINAKQAMPKGGEIIIRSRINENVNDGVRKSILQVDVIDTGIGIPPENIDDIFNPFFTTKQDGHGLGLATVYNIIKKHQGDIKVESKPNQGTTFSLFLPINKVDSDLQPSDCAKINFDRNVNILILDDNHEIIENMEEMFVDSNITVAGFSDPDLLIMDYANSIDTKKYDLVILDLTLLGFKIDGLGVLNKLKEINKNVKALVFSGHFDIPVVANYKEYGFVGRIEKPIVLQQFLSEINRVIED